MRLYESNNAVQFVYGECFYPTGGANDDATIGLRGASATDFNNRVEASGNFPATTQGGAISALVLYNNPTSHIAPTNGLTLTWTPVVVSCGNPTALSGTATSTTTANLSWTAPGLGTPLDTSGKFVQAELEEAEQ
ncbi:MAG: hypothetical protein IPJ79_00440 [Bacteroidetes bacterium]|nr:hypothetical protein [Bacteroidota bacterium]